MISDAKTSSRRVLRVISHVPAILLLLLSFPISTLDNKLITMREQPGCSGTTVPNLTNLFSPLRVTLNYTIGYNF